MRLWAAAALAIALSVAGARADNLQNAFDTVTAYLKKDDSGLVQFYDACPKKNADDEWLYAGSVLVVFINATDRAILVNAGQCNGGNGSSQYLYVIQRGAAQLVSGLGLADMSFLASNMYVDGDSLSLYGSRWMNNDAHCCPSRKATLEYNLQTHQHKLTLMPKDKS